MAESGYELAHPSIDWAAVQRQLDRIIRARLGRAQAADVQDCVGEAYLGLVRAVRREEIRNLAALTTTIAQRVVANWISARQGERKRFRPLATEDLRVGRPDPPEPWDRRDYIAFLVIEFFRERNASCCELAIAHFRGRDWKQLAVELGKSHEALRQQWSRCRAQFASAARKDPGPWLDLLNNDE
jgi:DNA-directed RNA polymerase specialized sigma24 family protein